MTLNNALYVFFFCGVFLVAKSVNILTADCSLCEMTE